MLYIKLSSNINKIFNFIQAAEQIRSLKPVSSEVEQIRSQQKDFADLKKQTLVPLGQNVSHCNKIGQGLVRSALQGVSTQQLEKDLEKMNDRWNALKDKVCYIYYNLSKNVQTKCAGKCLIGFSQ